jgi:hypothetical protein
VPSGGIKLMFPRPGDAVFVNALQVHENTVNEYVIELPVSAPTSAPGITSASQIQKLQRDVEQLQHQYYALRKGLLRKRAAMLNSEGLDFFERFVIGQSEHARLINPEALEQEKKARANGFTLS